MVVCTSPSWSVPVWSVPKCVPKCRLQLCSCVQAAVSLAGQFVTWPSVSCAVQHGGVRFWPRCLLTRAVQHEQTSGVAPGPPLTALYSRVHLSFGTWPSSGYAVQYGCHTPTVTHLAGTCHSLLEAERRVSQGQVTCPPQAIPTVVEGGRGSAVHLQVQARPA